MSRSKPIVFLSYDEIIERNVEQLQRLLSDPHAKGRLNRRHATQYQRRDTPHDQVRWVDAYGNNRRVVDLKTDHLQSLIAWLDNDASDEYKKRYARVGQAAQIELAKRARAVEWVEQPALEAMIQFVGDLDAAVWTKIADIIKGATTPAEADPSKAPAPYGWSDARRRAASAATGRRYNIFHKWHPGLTPDDGASLTEEQRQSILWTQETNEQAEPAPSPRPTEPPEPEQTGGRTAGLASEPVQAEPLPVWRFCKHTAARLISATPLTARCASCGAAVKPCVDDNGQPMFVRI